MSPTRAHVKVYPEPITDRYFRFFMGLLLAVSFLFLAPSVYGADPSKVYFVPLPEEQIRVSGATIEQSGNTIHTIVSISVVAGNTMLSASLPAAAGAGSSACCPQAEIRTSTRAIERMGDTYFMELPPLYCPL